MSPGGAASGYLTRTLAVAEVEVLKLRRDPTDLASRAVQPVLWLVLFGQVMTHAGVMSQAGGSYLDFLAPGILAQSVLFVSIFYGLSAIWERDLGVLQRYLVSPAPRSALVLGKALASSLRSLSQAIVVYVCAALLGVDLSWSPHHILGVAAFIALGSALFSTFSLVIACIVKTRERFMGVGQFLTMPIFFASNAIYPISAMPPWLRTIAAANPLTYQVDGLRALMLENGRSEHGLLLDYLVLLAVLIVMVVTASRMYPRLTR